MRSAPAGKDGEKQYNKQYNGVEHSLGDAHGVKP